MIVLALELRLSEVEVRQALLPIPLIARAQSQTTVSAEREAARLRRCSYGGAVCAA